MSDTAASPTAPDLLPLPDAVKLIERERDLQFVHMTSERLRFLKQILRGEFPPPAETTLPRDADNLPDWKECRWRREDLTEWITTAGGDTPDAAEIRRKRWSGANPAMQPADFERLASYAARFVVKGEGEWQYWQDRYHPVAIADEVLTFAVISGLVAVVLSWVPPIGALDSYVPRHLLIAAIIAIYFSVLLWRFVIRILNLTYRLTEERLIAVEGIVSRVEREARVLLVKDLSAHQQFLQRFFGVGTVHVYADDHDTPHVALHGIKDPVRVKELIWHVSETDKIEKCYFLETGNAPRA